jgi:ubiquinone/menaquinone biosynthesis C-methylase UbiE
MFREAMIPYEHPGEAWSEDEKDFLPIFMRLVGRNRRVLDLAGGYGRVTPYLVANSNSVILADLSIHSLRVAKKNLEGSSVGFIRIDMLHLPFARNVFDGVWFTQGFEYVPPDERESFLRVLREILKDKGVVFVNVAKIPNECSFFSYLKNYLYWKLIKRQQVIWGEYIYWINLEDYKGWHYHSAVFTRRIEQTIRKIGFKILKFEEYHKNGCPLTYLLQTCGKKPQSC